jgi:hypothetical protein
VTLDIDDTVDVVHGGQQLSFWNGHYGERCFLPTHVYDTYRPPPWRCCCGPARRCRGKEVAGHVRRLVRRIRCHWPDTRITLRGDGHYGRPEPMAWCEANGIDHIFGLPGNRTLLADPIIVREATPASPTGRCKGGWNCGAMPRRAMPPRRGVRPSAA